MTQQPNVSAVGALVGDPARATMLLSLLDGRALPAGELAYASGVTAQTASSHLAKLLHGGLLAVETSGRHRYYCLAGPHVAQAIELLGAIRPAAPVRRKALSAEARMLRFSRCCYDHLAGQLGVALTAELLVRDFIVSETERRYAVTPAARAWFKDLGMDVDALKPSRHGVARPCLDWTERTHHLAGPLGAAFLKLMCEQGWLRRAKGSRVVQVTPTGEVEITSRLGVDFLDLRSCAEHA